MSFEALRRIYDQRTGAPLVAARGHSQHVLYLLAAHADDFGWCFPSSPRLVKLSGLNRTTIFHGTKRIEDKNDARVLRVKGEGNFYILKYLQRWLRSDFDRRRAEDPEAPHSLAAPKWLLDLAARSARIAEALDSLNFEVLNKEAIRQFRAHRWY